MFDVQAPVVLPPRRLPSSVARRALTGLGDVTYWWVAVDRASDDEVRSLVRRLGGHEESARALAAAVGSDAWWLGDVHAVVERQGGRVVLVPDSDGSCVDVYVAGPAAADLTAELMGRV